MKITVLLLFISMFQLMAHTTNAQNTVINVTTNTLSVKELFNEIEKQTGYLVVFSNKEIDSNRHLIVKNKSAKISSFLEDAFKGTDIEYLVENNYIVLKKKTDDNVVNNTFATQQVQKQIKGIVTDEQGEPIIGANVVEKGTTNGTMTDIDGKFILQVPENTMLIVSYIGCLSQEIITTGKTALDIILKEDTQTLEEVVVVGYGTQKKSSLSAVISSVKGEEIEAVPATNLNAMISGRLPGIISRQGGGEPGKDETAIYIRGVSTTGNAAPLMVVDNVPRSASHYLNPNDIESITVLKDAAAVAPYGVAGANGVVLITTKKGKSGTPKLSYHGYVGIQNPTVLPDMVNAKEYMELKNIASINTGGPEVYSTDIIQKHMSGLDPDLYPNTNVWKENLSSNTIRTQHNVSLSGGTDVFQYYASLGYFHQDGFWKNVNFSDRFNLALDMSIQATQYTKVALSVKLSDYHSRHSSVGSTRLFELLYHDLPIHANKFSNGLWGSYSGPDIYESGYTKSKNRTIFSQLSIQQELPFLPGLSFRGNLAYDPTFSRLKTWSLPTYYYVISDATTTPYTYQKASLSQAKPFLSDSMSDNYRLTAQTGFDYATNIGKNHISTMALFEIISYSSASLGGSRNNYGLMVDELNMGSSNAADIGNHGSSSRQRQVGGVFRINYDYDSKYYLEASGRYDGHYYFAPDKKFGFFPAVSLGYRISEESFMQNIPWLTTLKIRGSYGESGALAGSPYQYLSMYGVSGSASILGNALQQGLYERSEPNPSITWEKAKKTNVGVDLNLWNHLFTLEADYFYEKRSNMLVSPSVTVPREYGIGLSQVNAAKMENRGIDLVAATNFSLGKDWLMIFKGTLTYAKNKVLEIFETPSTYDTPYRRRTGQPLNTVFAYKAIGYFQVEDFDDTGNLIPGITTQPWGQVYPGDVRYKDMNGDGKIDGNDETAIGTVSYPKTVYGFSGNIAYKNFSLDFLFQGVDGIKHLKRSTGTWLFNNGTGASKENLDYWTPENRNALNPRPTPAPMPNNTQRSSHWLKSNAYLRLKTATFGYTIPSVISQKMLISNLHIYLSGENLLTFTNYSNYDPECTHDEGRSFPLMRTISIGLNITF